MKESITRQVSSAKASRIASRRAKTMDSFVIPIGPLSDADRAKTYRDALKVIAQAGIDTQPGRTAHLQARSMSAWAQGILDALAAEEG